MIRLEQITSACPEQYDAFDADGRQVGYLRLRHGHFRVHLGGNGGPLVYEAHPCGDGIFDPDERDGFLSAAVAAIEGAMAQPDAVIG